MDRPTCPFSGMYDPDISRNYASGYLQRPGRVVGQSGGYSVHPLHVNLAELTSHNIYNGVVPRIFQAPAVPPANMVMPSRPRLMGPEDISPAKQEEKFALREKQHTPWSSFHGDVYVPGSTSLTLPTPPEESYNFPQSFQYIPKIGTVVGPSPYQAVDRGIIRTSVNAQQPQLDRNNATRYLVYDTMTPPASNTYAVDEPKMSNSKTTLVHNKDASQVKNHEPRLKSLGKSVTTNDLRTWSSGPELQETYTMSESRPHNKNGVANISDEGSCTGATIVSESRSSTSRFDKFSTHPQFSSHDLMQSQSSSIKGLKRSETDPSLLDKIAPNREANNDEHPEEHPQAGPQSFRDDNKCGLDLRSDSIFRPVPWESISKKSSMKKAACRFLPPGLPIPPNVKDPANLLLQSSLLPPEARLAESDTWFNTSGRGGNCKRDVCDKLAYETSQQLKQKAQDRGMEDENAALIGHLFETILSYRIPRSEKTKTDYFDPFEARPDCFYANQNSRTRSFFHADPIIDPWRLPVRYRLQNGQSSFENMKAHRQPQKASPCRTRT